MKKGGICFVGLGKKFADEFLERIGMEFVKSDVHSSVLYNEPLTWNVYKRI